MLRRFPIGCFVIVLVAGLSQSALADHNCCSVADWCVSHGGMTLEACTDAGGTYTASIGCSVGGACIDVKSEDTAPICSNNAPHDDCRALIEAGVPTVSEWGLATLLLLIVSAGTVMLLKRRDRVAV